MAFRFPLETLLKLRRSQERSERRSLGVVQQALAETERELDELRCIEEASRGELAEELRAGVVASEIHFLIECEKEHALRRRSLLERQEQLKREYREQWNTYRSAKQTRDTLDKLHDDEKSIYVRNQDRRQQRDSDERFLSRRKEPSH